MKHSAVEVYAIPKCDICDKEAKYDARLPSGICWANLCQEHFDLYECSLGMGYGQALLVKFDLLSADAKKAAMTSVRLDLYSIFPDARYTDEDIEEYCLKAKLNFYTDGRMVHNENEKL